MTCISYQSTSIFISLCCEQKSTKSSLETARTFATLFLDIDFRHQLLLAESEYEFKQLLHTRTKLLIEEQGLPENRKSHLVLSAFEQEEQEVCVLSDYRSMASTVLIYESIYYCN